MYVHISMGVRYPEYGGKILDTRVGYPHQGIGYLD